MRISLLFGLMLFVAIAHAQRTNTPATPVSTARPSATTVSQGAADRNANNTRSATDRTNTTKTGSEVTKSRRTTPRAASVYPAPQVQQLDGNKSTDNRSNTEQNAGKTAGKNVNAAATATVHNSASAAPEQPVKVEWLSIEEAQERCKTEKRKIFVDVYTGWCGWCKRMDETTFSDPAIAKYLNENYYPVKLDAEQEQEIVFKGKTYQYKKMGVRGYHEFAVELLNNRLSFPTVVFLNEDLEVIQALATYLDAPKFETIINYFGTDNHKKTPWESYERNFVRTASAGQRR